ncbi:MAG: hypothetical protein PHQ66_03845 [Candidatus Nanoarchaeia archaeon]|nr:hypothetical protein [Candidatus Nanoarchaeia archaeon]MDD5358184.1 hypothetical protein [Candidatus Nanoarchaeia archaeon]MDD5589450.1 hypothetical protein [Candidatus Nanoarchaeia archaeon]
MEKLEIKIRVDRINCRYKFDIKTESSNFENISLQESLKLGYHGLLQKVMKEYSNSKEKKRNNNYEAIPIKRKIFQNLEDNEIVIDDKKRILNPNEVFEFNRDGCLYLENNKFIIADYSNKNKKSEKK